MGIKMANNLCLQKVPFYEPSPLDGVFQTVSIDGIAVGAIHKPITPVYTWSNFERVKRGEEVEEEDGSNANQ